MRTFIVGIPFPVFLFLYPPWPSGFSPSLFSHRVLPSHRPQRDWSDKIRHIHWCKRSIPLIFVFRMKTMTTFLNTLATAMMALFYSLSLKWVRPIRSGEMNILRICSCIDVLVLEKHLQVFSTLLLLFTWGTVAVEDTSCTARGLLGMCCPAAPKWHFRHLRILHSTIRTKRTYGTKSIICKQENNLKLYV